MKYLIAALILVVACTGVHAEPSSVAPVMAGMKFKAGLICNHPQPTYELIKVVNDEQMYVTYFTGYGAISGVCFQSGNTMFTLVHKWKITNKSYDGYNAEMWEVQMYDGATMWAIITPDVLEHRIGTAI